MIEQDLCFTDIEKSIQNPTLPQDEKPSSIESCSATPSSISPSKKHNIFVDHTIQFLNSFKRKSNVKYIEDSLDHTIQPRHILLISLGTGIGTGLLVGTGTVLANAGPLGLVLGYLISSIMIWLIIQSAGELGVVYSQLVGNFIRYPSFLVDSSFGFAMSTIYTFQWCTVLPLQLVTASMIINYWNTNVALNIFVLIFLILIVLINVCGGARGYVEFEFFCNMCKILMVIMFVILGILLISGAVGQEGYIGFKRWTNPGLFAHGFKGVCTTFCYAAFSYGGCETLVLTAAEQANPQKSIPMAARRIIYRILFIYMLTMIIICFLVSSNDPRLLSDQVNTTNDGDFISSSPFVIAIESSGIKIVPDIINVIILISVLSVANSSLYAAPRLLLSMSQEGILPNFLNYIDKAGRPLFCYLIVICFGMLGFVADTKHREDVFVWLLSISGLGQIFIWMSICLSHIRFRRALQVQNGKLKRTVDDLIYRSPLGIWGSWFAILLAMLIIICQVWISMFPISNQGHFDWLQMLKQSLAIPIWLAAYCSHKIYHKNWSLRIRAADIDLHWDDAK